MRHHGMPDLVGMIVALIGLGAAASPSAADVLYQTGFEPPTFSPGLLAGQDGWFAGLSPAAATVSTVQPRGGTQSVCIQGSLLDALQGFSIGSYARFLSYDPIASGNPQVSLSADINLSGGVPPSCGAGIGLTGILNGQFTANIQVGVRAQGSGVAAYISNFDGQDADGPAYTLGEWATVRADFNFQTRTVRGFFNDRLFGEVPFTAGISNDIAAINLFLLSGQPIPDVVAYGDNLRVDAVPEPGTLGLLAAGLAGVVAYRRVRGVRG